MEEKNNNKRRLLYTLIGVVALMASVGGSYAFFSASISNNNSIGGQTQNISGDSLRLSVSQVTFSGIDTSIVPSNDLVPAFFGLNNSNQLNVANPSQLGLSNVQAMIQNKCVSTSDGFTGCQVWKIAISSDQNIEHANLLLNLSVSDNSESDVSVVDKSQWGYVVFTASANSSTTGALGSGTQTNIVGGATTNLVLNTNNGAPAAIGNGVTGLDIHNDQRLIGCNSAGLPQEVVYYLLVYVNDTNVSQNTSTSGTGNSSYAVGSYSGTLELRGLGGKVRTTFGRTGLDLMRGSGVEQSSIVRIFTVDNTNVPANAVDSWNVSGGNNVVAWTVENTGGQNPTYDLYIGQNGGVVASANSTGLFSGFTNVTSIDLSNLDTSNVTNASRMFNHCESITALDFTGLNLSNAISNSGMFDMTYSLTSLTTDSEDERGLCNAINHSEGVGSSTGASTPISLNNGSMTCYGKYYITPGYPGGGSGQEY